MTNDKDAKNQKDSTNSVANNTQVGGRSNVQINIAQMLGGTVVGKLYKIVIEKIEVSPWVLAPPVLILVVLGGIIAYSNWLNSQPKQMPEGPGYFNIAVAEFKDNSGSGTLVASKISQDLFNFIDAEIKQGTFSLKVEVAHNNIGVISESSDAEALAKQIHAHVIVFGTVSVNNNNVSVSPRFYVSAFQTEVAGMVGVHGLALPVTLTVGEVEDPTSGGVTNLQNKSKILIEFTKGLVYFASKKFYEANRSVESAATAVQSDNTGKFAGVEPLFILGANIAMYQSTPNPVIAQNYVDLALTANPTYARAYIAQGNIYYSKKDFDNARKYYESALQQPDMPMEARIPEKVHISLANIYTYFIQEVPPSDKQKFADSARKEFQPVIDQYIKGQEDDLKQLAANAYLDSGICFFELGDGFKQQAIEAFGKALELGEGTLVNDAAQYWLQKLQATPTP